MQEALDEHRAVVGQPLLELVDLGVAGLPHVLRHELVDPDDQHVLVLRPVEDADHPRTRYLSLDPGQVVLAALGLGRRLEGLDPDALRVDQADRVPDRAALAGGVHSLQHDQDLGRPFGHRPPRRVQPLLEVSELRGQGLGGGRGVGLLAGEAGGAGGVQAGQVDGAGRQSEQLGEW